MRSRERSSTISGGTTIMSVTQRPSGLAGSAMEYPESVDDGGVVVTPAHYGGQNPPPQGDRVPVRELLGDEVLDLLLAQSTDEAGQLKLTGEGSMLGDLVKAVLERALEAELTAHLGYGKHEMSG